MRLPVRKSVHAGRQARNGLRNRSTPDGKPSMWVVTKDNIGSFAEPYPIVADYQKQFATLWGLR